MTEPCTEALPRGARGRHVPLSGTHPSIQPDATVRSFGHLADFRARQLLLKYPGVPQRPAGRGAIMNPPILSRHRQPKRSRIRGSDTVPQASAGTERQVQEHPTGTRHEMTRLPGLPGHIARHSQRRRRPRPAAGPRTSHDQNFKNLILTYPQASLAFFAAAEGITLDDDLDITFLRQEPAKHRLRDRALILDTPMRVHWRSGARPDVIFLFEEESSTRHFSVARMLRYTATLIHTEKTRDVCPVGIFLKRGSIDERLTVDGRSRRYVDFTFLPCQLPTLQAASFADSPNIVARLTSVCMAYPTDSLSRVQVYGQAVRGLLALEKDPDLRQNGLDFIETYLTLSATEWRSYQQLYPSENTKMGAFTQRWLEQGRQEGMETGMQQGILLGEERGLLGGRQQTLAEQLTERFGPLDNTATARIASASLDELKHWTRQILTARKLEDVFRLQ